MISTFISKNDKFYGFLLRPKQSVEIFALRSARE